MSLFQSLPAEILVDIFCSLETFSDAFNFGATCHRVSSVLASPELSKEIEKCIIARNPSRYQRHFGTDREHYLRQSSHFRTRCPIIDGTVAGKEAIYMVDSTLLRRERNRPMRLLDLPEVDLREYCWKDCMLYYRRPDPDPGALDNWLKKPFELIYTEWFPRRAIAQDVQPDHFFCSAAAVAKNAVSLPMLLDFHRRLCERVKSLDLTLAEPVSYSEERWVLPRFNSGEYRLRPTFEKAIIVLDHDRVLNQKASRWDAQEKDWSRGGALVLLQPGVSPDEFGLGSRPNDVRDCILEAEIGNNLTVYRVSLERAVQAVIWPDPSRRNLRREVRQFYDWIQAPRGAMSGIDIVANNQYRLGCRRLTER